MKKEEVLLHAVGMLPDEMAVQDVTEELLAGAANIEREEKRHNLIHKCSYALAAAACFAVIITGLNISGRYNIRQPDTINDSKVNIITSENNSGDAGIIKSSEKNDYIRLFVYGDISSKEQQKSTSEDKSHDGSSIKYGSIKEILYGKTVKLETVKEMQANAVGKKTKGAEYIVFGMERDFYFTVSNNTGRTYILNPKSGKKRFVKGDEVLCKAGNKVYFDISGIKTDKDSFSNTDAWDKDSMEIIAFTEIYIKDNQDIKQAGSFYIGRKTGNKSEKGKKGDMYYGFFKGKNSN